MLYLVHIEEYQLHLKDISSQLFMLLLLLFLSILQTLIWLGENKYSFSSNIMAIIDVVARRRKWGKRKKFFFLKKLNF